MSKHFRLVMANPSQKEGDGIFLYLLASKCISCLQILRQLLDLTLVSTKLAFDDHGETIQRPLVH